MEAVIWRLSKARTRQLSFSFFAVCVRVLFNINTCKTSVRQRNFRSRTLNSAQNLFRIENEAIYRQQGEQLKQTMTTLVLFSTHSV